MGTFGFLTDRDEIQVLTDMHGGGSYDVPCPGHCATLVTSY